MKKFRGTFVVVTTPFGAFDTLDDEGLRGNIDWYIEEGIHGIVCTGSTGEFDCLSDDEREEVVKIVVDQVNHRVPVLAGSAGRSTSETVRWSKYAEDIGADGVMIAPPYYCLPSDDELFEHYKIVAEATDIPIMIYNNPFTTGVDMKPDLVAKCAEIENISYTKESSGDVKRVHRIIQLTGEKMTVFCGWDDLALESIVVGAQGWIAAVANIVPSMAKDLFELVADEGDLLRGRQLYYRILPLCSFLEEGKFVQKTKAAQNMIGKTTGGLPRRPRLPITKEEEEKLKKIISDLGILQE